MSNHPPHLKNSPSAFIPFCEYTGNMLSVGEYIENFDFPVCNSFRPTVLGGQLCYQFDVNSIETNTTSGQPYLMFVLDYNEDREYNTLSDMDEDEHKDDPKALHEIDKNNDNNNEAMIYIETLGKINHILNRFQYGYAFKLLAKLQQII